MKKFMFLLFIYLPTQVFAQNVGIGTTTPTAKLEVKNPGSSVLKISSNGYFDTTELILSNKTSGGFGTDFLLTSPQEQGLFLTSASDLSTNTNDSLVSILINGNVGIGVKTPTSKLHIHSPSSAVTYMYITNNATGVAAGDGLQIGMVSNNAVIVNKEAGSLQLATSNIIRLTIDAGGNTEIQGELNRPSSGAANLVPVCYGNVASAGFANLAGSMTNFTVSKLGTGIYIITITGEPYQFQSYVTLITTVGTPATFATHSSGSGQLQVFTWDATGAATDASFHFIVYKL